MTIVPAIRSTLLLVTLGILFVAPFVESLASPKPDIRTTRRSLFQCVACVATSALFTLSQEPKPASATDSSDMDTSLSALSSQVEQARGQLEKVPKLIEGEQWDAVRNLLVEPPLADCWAKTNRPLITKYAEVLGDSGGDELEALEAREELVSHLRYLDIQN